MCERASKQSPDLKIYTVPELGTQVLKFLDPPMNTTKCDNPLDKTS